MSTPHPDVARAGREAWVARMVAAGELVPNDAFRERVEFLMAHDPEFSLVTVCLRLADLGYPTYVKKPSGTTRTKRLSGDTSHLQRALGMRDLTQTVKKGRRYVPQRRTSHVSYEFAVALCRALDMDPVDCGV